MKIYKILFLTFLLLSNSNICLADVEVPVNPLTKITTSNPSLSEGDSVLFSVQKDIYSKGKLIIRQGSAAQGQISYLKPNGWAGDYAKITIENIRTKTISNKIVHLQGAVYKDGNSHGGILDVINTWCVRGGEVQLNPGNTFILTLKENM